MAHSSRSLKNEISVKDVMDTWTLQMGYPVVTVTRNYLNNSMKIKQTRFLDGTPNPDIQVSTLPRITAKFYWLSFALILKSINQNRH